MLASLASLALTACPALPHPLPAHSAPAPPGAPQEVGPDLPQPQPGPQALGLALEAEKEHAADRLAAAAHLWSEAHEAGLSKTPHPVPQARALAADAELRLAYRSALLRHRKSDRSWWSRRGIMDLSAHEIRTPKQQLAWSDFPAGQLDALTEELGLGPIPRVGRDLEHLAQAGVQLDEKVAERLHRHLGVGLLEGEVLVAALARYRGEPPPSGGYLFSAAQWFPADSEVGVILFAKLQDSAQTLIHASDDPQRSLALAKLLDAAPTSAPARRLLEDSVAALLENGLRPFRSGPAMRRLKRLPEDRWRVDWLRAAYLRSMFPKNPLNSPLRGSPAPPGLVRGFVKLRGNQRKLLGALRNEWNRARSYSLAKDLRLRLDRVHWLNRQEHNGLELAAWPDDLPEWILGLPTLLAQVSVQSFGWDRAQALELRRQRKIPTENSRLWKLPQYLDLRRPESPSRAEQGALRTINEYRRLLGFRPFQWDPELQTCAQGHATYLQVAGRFSHEHDEPDSATPTLRALQAGYAYPVAENIFEGRDSDEAIEAWIASVEHHRNLLSTHMLQAAVAADGNKWVLVMGTGR